METLTVFLSVLVWIYFFWETKEVCVELLIQMETVFLFGNFWKELLKKEDRFYLFKWFHMDSLIIFFTSETRVMSFGVGLINLSRWSDSGAGILERETQLSLTRTRKWCLNPVGDRCRLLKSLFTVRGRLDAYSLTTNMRISKTTKLDLTGRWSDIALRKVMSKETSIFKYFLFIKLYNVVKINEYKLILILNAIIFILIFKLNTNFRFLFR